MPETLRFKCANCGSTIKAASKFRGKTVKCPKCGNSLKLPKLQKSKQEASTTVRKKPRLVEITDFQEDDDFLDEPRRKTRKSPPASEDQFDDYEDDFEDYGDGDDHDFEPPPRRTPSRKKKKKKKRKRRRSNSSDDGGVFGLENRMLSGGVLGGIGMMIGAVAWFVVGLMNDYIFFYPPILFVVGLVAFFKGLFSSD